MATRRVGASRIRTWGDAGHPVIVLHGGPAAVGGAAGLARGLADRFRVIEPWQRGSGPQPLTVATHIADLHELVTAECAERPAIVGESWGAMLALAYAAEHPDAVAAIALIGCGTFDRVARARLQATLAERANPSSAYDYALIDPVPEDEVQEPFDRAAHTQTWDDMVRLQAAGVYPAAFAAISSPVLMLHGLYDPHPGRMIRDSLRPYLPNLKYVEWERCGHSPWKERFARDDFFRVLESWLTQTLES
jgi:pimeloyl-ACP methyl ester carboxylesterase